MTTAIVDTCCPESGRQPKRRPARTRRRGLLGLLAATVLAPMVTVVVAATPAHADCASIPPDRDVNVTRKVFEVGQRLGVNDKVMLAGFETGIVESHMNNLNCGDRDSLGVFQQRPSQGWGTPEQVMNVDFAANTFFTRAIVKDQQHPEYSPGQLAQSVQVSAYPDRYDAVEGQARAQMGEAFQPYGTIGDKWQASGGAGSPVGNPVRAEEWGKIGARFQEFEHGMIIWNPNNNQAWMVHGAILIKYRDTGSEEAWGFPVMDEFDASASPTGAKGKFQKFDNALILWSAATDVHLIHGAIRTYFEDNGYEARFGYPTSDEIGEGDGFRQTFELGTIHWTAAAGASWAQGG